MERQRQQVKEEFVEIEIIPENMENQRQQVEEEFVEIEIIPENMENQRQQVEEEFVEIEITPENMENQRQQVEEEFVEIEIKPENMENQRQQVEVEESEEIGPEQIYHYPGLPSTESSINKVYKICMDHCKKLQQSLFMIAAEKDAQSAMLQKAVQEVQDLTQRQVQWADQKQLLIDTLQSIVRVNYEQRAETQQQLFIAQSARQQAEAEIRELKDQLEAALSNNEYLSGMLKQESNTRSADANTTRRRQFEQQNEMPSHSRSNIDEERIEEGCNCQNNKKRKI